MFGVGPMELVIIALFAVVFIGPKKLPDVMRQLGRFFVQARRYTNDVRDQFQSVVDDAENELRMEELAELKAQLAAVSPQKMLNDAVGSLDPNDPHHPMPPEAAAFAPIAPVALTQAPENPAELTPSHHFDDPHLRGTTLDEPAASTDHSSPNPPAGGGGKTS